jgi:hypothetical protein
MKKRVYIHAGLHKTGTSSIQVELTRARHLLEPRGFLYPVAGMPEWAPFGHHLLPWSLVEDQELIPSVRGHHPGGFQDDDREAIWAALRREIDGSDLPNVILSSEEFDILDRPALDRLSARLKGFDVVPILFLRNLGDLVESGYRTAVLISGFSHGIAHYADHQRTRSDYFQLLQDWKSVSSSGELFVVSYDDEYLRTDVVLSFLRLMGLSADAIEPIRLPKQNESAPAFVVEIVRFLRSLGAQEADVASWMKTISHLPYRDGVNERYSLLNDELRGELDSRYMRELDLIRSDDALAGQVLGKLMIPAVPSRVCVQNISQALAALSSELTAAV